MSSWNINFTTVFFFWSTWVPSKTGLKEFLQFQVHELSFSFFFMFSVPHRNSFAYRHHLHVLRSSTGGIMFRWGYVPVTVWVSVFSSCSPFLPSSPYFYISLESVFFFTSAHPFIVCRGGVHRRVILGPPVQRYWARKPKFKLKSFNPFTTRIWASFNWALYSPVQ